MAVEILFTLFFIPRSNSPEIAGRIENAHTITLRMMLQQRSGIPDFIDRPDFLWSEPPLGIGEALDLKENDYLIPGGSMVPCLTGTGRQSVHPSINMSIPESYRVIKVLQDTTRE